MPSNTPTTETIIPELLTLYQAMEFCDVSQRTLWTWAHDGSAPAALKIGKGTTTSYSRADYLDWIPRGCRPLNGGADHE